MRPDASAGGGAGGGDDDVSTTHPPTEAAVMRDDDDANARRTNALPSFMEASTTEDIEVLGRRLTLEVDPARLNEAGVVWGPAVRALADAVAPFLLRRRREKFLAFFGDEDGLCHHASSTSDGASIGDDDRARVSCLELGAGTGALGIALAAAVPDLDVTLTDLPRVVPLLARNAARAAEDARHVNNGGTLAPGSAVDVAALDWAADRVPPPPPRRPTDAAGGEEAREDEGEGNRGRRAWDVVLGCEILYWGGWDIFDEDTRGPLLSTLVAACESGGGRGGDGGDGGHETEIALAFTVRDKSRETGFVLGEMGDVFWLRLLDGDGGGVDERRDAARLARDDAEARAALTAAAEGDLILFGGALKNRGRGWPEDG